MGLDILGWELILSVLERILVGLSENEPRSHVQADACNQLMRLASLSSTRGKLIYIISEACVDVLLCRAEQPAVVPPAKAKDAARKLLIGPKFNSREASQWHQHNPGIASSFAE